MPREWPGGWFASWTRGLLRWSAGLVPFARRGRWLEEWEAELWVLVERGAHGARLVRFGVGAFMHALAERRDGEGWMGGLRDDLRLAVRRMMRRPGFALVAVLILALGVGANTALFSALRAALLSEPPYPDVERLVLVDMLLSSNAEAQKDTMNWSYPKFELLARDARSVESLAGFAPSSATLTGLGDPTRLGLELVSPAYFDLLGVRPVAGRFFRDDEVPPDPGAVVILSHALWTTRFGADPGAVGRVITLGGNGMEVVGVAPEGFRGLTGAAEAWVPLAGAATLQSPRRLQLAWAHWLRVAGRLRPGVDLAAARTEAEGIGARLTEVYPDRSGGGAHGATVVPFVRARVNPVARLAVAAVSAAAVLLLLIACGNVAGLFVARASAERADVAVRSALGAGRARLVREHLLESVLLAGAGGACGIMLAVAGARVVPAAIGYALETSGTRGLQYLDPTAMEVDALTLLAGVVLALLAGLAFGVLPARAAASGDLITDLRAGAAGSGGAASRHTLRGVLVASQLALTLVLLAGAGLMAVSFHRLDAVAIGFTEESVLAVSYDHGPGSAADEIRAFEAGALERVEAIPGVTGAAFAPCAPLTGRCEITGIRRIDDEPPIDYGEMQGILTYEVSPAYFETIGAALLEGRAFGLQDGPDDPPSVILNRAAAETLFPDGALGHRLAVTHALTEEVRATVVGVVGDVRYAGLQEPVMPAAYFSRTQAPSPYGTLLVRTAGEPRELTGAVREALGAIAPDLPLFRLTSLGEQRALHTARTRVILGLLLAFSLSGLLLSSVGLYALVSFTVARRTREVGLRIALGADRAGVVRLVARAPVAFALAGALAGTLGAVVLTRALRTLLFEVSPSDPAVLGASAAVLVAVAVAAAVVPALRAVRVDPTEALRAD